ncbi:hypothetical protein [Dulcicalothrix desertica]|uniref:hypothetical protein n=1 Tax=Dulcicalothrix desertica TaxID=32056 RepID=UPI000F8F7810|nr:hypothetical protein [Dulcicalothrix desertica]TWH40826.1 hypothetical protein CAL7102_10187 [Dulcicalothrix desertica PCC 7102]
MESRQLSIFDYAQQSPVKQKFPFPVVTSIASRLINVPPSTLLRHKQQPLVRRLGNCNFLVCYAGKVRRDCT